MKDSATAALNTDLKSVGGLIGGELVRLKNEVTKDKPMYVEELLLKQLAMQWCFRS